MVKNLADAFEGQMQPTLVMASPVPLTPTSDHSRSLPPTPATIPAGQQAPQTTAESTLPSNLKKERKARRSRPPSSARSEPATRSHELRAI